MQKLSGLKKALILVGIMLMTFPVYAAATELTFMGAWGAENRLETLQQIVSQFEAKNPDIKVTVVNIKGWLNVEEKAQTMIAGGASPDLLYMGETGGLQSFAASDLLESLDSYITRDKVNLRNFIPSALQMGKYKNQVYGLPIDSITSVFCYNLDLLGQAGLKGPAGTQTELLDMAKKLKSVTGDAPSVQIGNPWSMLRFAEFLYPNGGRFLTDDADDELFLSEPVRKTTKMVSDALKQQLFYVGKAIPEEWLMGSIPIISAQPILTIRTDTADTLFQYSAAPVPAGDGGDKGYGWGHYFAIPKASANKEAAWKLIQFVLQSEMAFKWAQEMQFMPSQINVLQGTTYFANSPTWRAFFMQLENSDPLPQTEYYRDINSIFTKEMKPVFQTGDVAPDQALQNISTQVRALMGL